MKDIKEILASDRFIEDKNKGFTFDGLLVKSLIYKKNLPMYAASLICLV